MERIVPAETDNGAPTTVIVTQQPDRETGLMADKDGLALIRTVIDEQKHNSYA
jgi:hypothetical protein